MCYSILSTNHRPFESSIAHYHYSATTATTSTSLRHPERAHTPTTCFDTRQLCIHPLYPRPLPLLPVFFTMAPVAFWSNPSLYIKWASRHKPAIFWSLVVGSMGPIMAFTVPPIRRAMGEKPRPQVPLTYPSECFSFQAIEHYTAQIMLSRRLLI